MNTDSAFLPTKVLRDIQDRHALRLREVERKTRELLADRTEVRELVSDHLYDSDIDAALSNLCMHYQEFGNTDTPAAAELVELLTRLARRRVEDQVPPVDEDETESRCEL